MAKKRAAAKKRTKTAERYVEKSYANKQVAAKLRRLADALEAGKTFSIQIAGERVSIPPYAVVEFEHSREAGEEEVEIELKWKPR
jgi:amphi-Trp domain-containing protein